MPDELATVEWLAMGPAEFSLYIPFYGSLVTDTYEMYYGPDARTYNAENPDENTLYWVFRELYAQCTASTLAERERLGNGVRAFWEDYQKSLISQQAAVDAYMTNILYSQGRAAAEAVATEISMRISEEAYGYAKQILAELKAFKAAGTSGDFIPSVCAMPAYAQVKLSNGSVENGNGQAKVNFPIASANGKGYTVSISTTENGIYQTYSNINFNAQGAHIKGLTNGNIYYAVIEYADASGVTLKTDPILLEPNK